MVISTAITATEAVVVAAVVVAVFVVVVVVVVVTVVVVAIVVVIIVMVIVIVVHASCFQYLVWVSYLPRLQRITPDVIVVTIGNDSLHQCQA